MYGFRYYFTPRSGVLFIISSRYLCAIGRQRVFSLGRWASRIHAGFHGTGATWEIAQGGSTLSPTGLSPSVAGLSRTFRLEMTFVTPPGCLTILKRNSRNPQSATRKGLNTDQVWALPISLATTQGIEVSFSSWGYLDVSVPPVTARGL